MNKLETNQTKIRPRATVGEELGLLVNLLRAEKIGYRTLLRSVAEVVADDYELVITAVLILTDRKKIMAAGITPVEFEDALVAVRCADEFRGKETVIAAIADAMKAGW